MSKIKTTTTVKRGRPTVEGSKRQAVLAMRAAKVAAGGEIKRGRPATRNKTTEITVEVKAKPSKAQRQAAMKKPAMIEVVDVNEAIEA